MRELFQKGGISVTAKKWKTKIKKACTDAGTYRPYFDSVIVTLADILEKRDEAAQQLEDSGGKVVIEYTNKAGATNLTKNPLMVMWDDLNKTALTYWRDLGLTPKGLKAIDEAAMKPKKQSALDKVLGDLCG